jgi:hypothetical protein
MKKLKRMLEILTGKLGLVALKGGTEVEDMTFNEIIFLKMIAEPDIPVIVKIGGPEARNDMRELMRINIDGILAPMVESEYALKNFIESLHEIYSGSRLPYSAINIETITSYKNIDSIISSIYFSALDQVTVGRTDLSGSMNKKPDDNEVIAVTSEIIRLSREKGKVTSVGGAIHTSNAQRILDLICPDRINTRHLIFDCSETIGIDESVKLGLEFELELYKNFMKVEPSKEEAYRRRMETTKNRIIPKVEMAAVHVI